MAFRFVGRTDDELQWTWKGPNYLDGTGGDTQSFDDGFRKVYPSRLPRGGEAGRRATRSSEGTKWTITSGDSWDDGDLLRLNDPDNSDFDLRELTSADETVIAVALEDISSGSRADTPELDTYLGSPMPAHAIVTDKMLFATTDVNGVTPDADTHEGEQAGLSLSGGAWQIDVTGSGDLHIERVDENRGEYIVRFLANKIQTHPHE